MRTATDIVDIFPRLDDTMFGGPSEKEQGPLGISLPATSQGAGLVPVRKSGALHAFFMRGICILMVNTNMAEGTASE